MKKQRHYFANKGLSSQSYVFSSSHIWMWEFTKKQNSNNKKIKKAEHWRIDAFEVWCYRSPLDSKGIQPVKPKGNQSWIFIERIDAEAETLIIWPPDVKNWLTGKDPDAGKDWRQEEEETTEDEMAGWHHLLNGHEFE